MRSFPDLLTRKTEEEESEPEEELLEEDFDFFFFFLSFFACFFFLASFLSFLFLLEASCLLDLPSFFASSFFAFLTSGSQNPTSTSSSVLPSSWASSTSLCPPDSPVGVLGAARSFRWGFSVAPSFFLDLSSSSPNSRRSRVTISDS